MLIIDCDLFIKYLLNISNIAKQNAENNNMMAKIPFSCCILSKHVIIMPNKLILTARILVRICSLRKIREKSTTHSGMEKFMMIVASRDNFFKLMIYKNMPIVINIARIVWIISFDFTTLGVKFFMALFLNLINGRSVKFAKRKRKNSVSRAFVGTYFIIISLATLNMLANARKMLPFKNWRLVKIIHFHIFKILLIMQACS